MRRTIGRLVTPILDILTAFRNEFLREYLWSRREDDIVAIVSELFVSIVAFLHVDYK